MNETTPPDPSAKSRSLKAINLFLGLIAGCGVAFSLGGFLWGGVDFLKGVLLGFLIVLLNAYWTKRLVGAMVFGSGPKGLATAVFVLKLGVTAAILFLAILKFHFDPLAVLVGLSSLIGATVIYSVVHRAEG